MIFLETVMASWFRRKPSQDDIAREQQLLEIDELYDRVETLTNSVDKLKAGRTPEILQNVLRRLDLIEKGGWRPSDSVEKKFQAIQTANRQAAAERADLVKQIAKCKEATMPNTLAQSKRLDDLQQRISTIAERRIQIICGDLESIERKMASIKGRVSKLERKWREWEQGEQR